MTTCSDEALEALVNSIRELEDEMSGYRIEYKQATGEDRKRLLNVIAARGTALNDLKKERER
jgi:hypothetical protein